MTSGSVDCRCKRANLTARPMLALRSSRCLRVEIVADDLSAIERNRASAIAGAFFVSLSAGICLLWIVRFARPQSGPARPLTFGRLTPLCTKTCIRLIRRVYAAARIGRGLFLRISATKSSSACRVEPFVNGEGVALPAKWDQLGWGLRAKGGGDIGRACPCAHLDTNWPRNREGPWWFALGAAQAKAR